MEEDPIQEQQEPVQKAAAKPHPQTTEDPNTLVVRISKSEQMVTMTFKTGNGGNVEIGLKVLSVEESETSFSFILSKDASIKLPPLEVFKLTLQNGAVHAVSFLGGEGNIGNCKYLWLIKTDMSKLNQ